ncbi:MULTISPECIES: hypothetical protein [unclassified Streptomyces]|uniref:hypothetical protein n=1 Tax=unclassified Streptomyces TaxID=2593676 RepID=UPI003FCFC748
MSTAPTPERPESADGPADPAARLDFDDPLGRQSTDDTDRGWGERPSAGDSAADLARFLDEKPPHHI